MQVKFVIHLQIQGRKMKLILLFCVVIAAVLGENPFIDYHVRIGIPLAARIKKAETAAILSGSRIIGGQPAPLGAHPYLVGVVIHFTNGAISACGSSMLSNTRVITAAHCWRSFTTQAEMFTLVFGSEYIFYGGVRVDTSDVIEHEGWDALSAFEFDLAIVNFNHVAYTNVIQPISLPSGALETNNFAGVWAQASGWGMIGDGILLAPDQVQSHVTLQVLSNTACHQFYNPMIITDRILCTNGVGPVGVCSSDSGGPLSIVSNNQRVLIGVVSFGSVRCEDDYPSGFVRVTAHLPWIRERL